MATAKSLQKPQIISVDGATIRVRHPDISRYPRTYLASPINASGTSMTVLDNNGFADDDWFIIGEIGDSKTEECDVNGAVTRGASMTVTNTLKFAHELDSPVTRIQERKITIYGASSDGGSLTAIIATGSAIGIRWDKPYTEYTLKTTDTAYSYYVVKFYDGTTESSASDYIASSGHGVDSVQYIIQEALDATGAEVNSRIDYQFLIRCVDSCQNRIVNFIDKTNNVRKYWSFEVVEDTTSLDAATMENSFALSSLASEMKYGETPQSILNVRIGSEIIHQYSIEDHDANMQGVHLTTAASSASIGATTFVVSDISEFSDAGTLLVGSNVITYTAKDDSTNTFSGIPASGAGSITANISSGATVWQGISGGMPERYTVFNGRLIFSRPFSSSYNGWPIKIRYVKKLSRLTELSDVTEIPFPFVFANYVAYKIELRRGNFEKAQTFLLLFESQIQEISKTDKSYALDVYRYHNFEDGDIASDSDWDSYPNVLNGLNNPLT